MKNDEMINLGQSYFNDQFKMVQYTLMDAVYSLLYENEKYYPEYFFTLTTEGYASDELQTDFNALVFYN